MREKRKFLRLPFDIEDGIFGVLRNPKIDTEPIAANIMDLSKGGLKFALPKNKAKGLRKGRLLFLTAVVGTANWEFNGQAELEIRWIKKNQINDNVLFGCEFKSLPETEKLQYEEFVNREMSWKERDIMSHPVREVDTIRGREMSNDSKKHMRNYIIGSTAILVLVAIFFILFTFGRKNLKQEMAFLNEHIDKIEVGRMHNKSIEETISNLENREESFQQSTPQTIDSLSAQINELAAAVDQLKKNLESVSPKQTASQTPQISMLAQKKYHEVSPDETLYRIGKHYGISVKNLQDMNRLGPNQRIFPGQKLLISLDS